MARRFFDFGRAVVRFRALARPLVFPIAFRDFPAALFDFARPFFRAIVFREREEVFF